MYPKYIRIFEKILNSRFFGLFLFVLITVIIILLWLNKNLLPLSSRYGYFGIFLANLLASSTVIIPLPGAAAVFLGGSLWNPVLVGISAGIGATIGEITGYLAGYGGRNIVMKINKNIWFKYIEKLFQKSGFITILVTSCIPFPFFDLIGMISGAVKYPFWKFLLAVAIGRIIRDIVIAWSGAKILPY